MVVPVLVAGNLVQKAPDRALRAAIEPGRRISGVTELPCGRALRSAQRSGQVHDGNRVGRQVHRAFSRLAGTGELSEVRGGSPTDGQDCPREETEYRKSDEPFHCQVSMTEL
jgi:hypothetical protein